MTVAAPLNFENTFRELEGLYVPWRSADFPEPRLLVVNEALAAELGVEGLTAEQLLAPDGIAQVYSGHQFGTYSGRLGDGRALLLGEVVDANGQRRDVHLKGSGRTPFARGGDGKAVLAPMLREYVIGEAMHALGIPTSRALAVLTTGERVMRDGAPFPGAVLVRVAASHIRVGTFEYAARHADVRRLADYSMRRHHPEASDYLDFYTRVVDAQAALIARWMHVGFIHGVMNTDNMAISGETIDYGPCAFMDAYDPATVYSSIDYGGRYAYGNQPAIAAWNLARFGETLLSLIDADDPVKAVTAALETFDERFNAHWLTGMQAKLGLSEPNEALITEFMSALRGRDYTSAFSPKDGINPIYIPRNHLVEEALTAATAGDMEPFQRLVDVVSRPFEERPGLERYAQGAPSDFGPYRTFCGT